MYNVCMERINVYLTSEQIFFLKSLNGHLSEHLRRAIDDYMKKMSNVSRSPSRKVVIKNG